MSTTFEDFRTLRRPVVTEKSYAAQGAANQYSFRVESSATKRQIKHAIESIFEVKVEKVQVINMPGKPKRRGTHAGFRSGYRKAVVRLAEGETLDVAEEA
ncbi:MAG: 50S ribosomal protein L23 [Zetaproteobacteria bacterium]|nr:MAG: 50S ribosomal protein L23 [Zetaproteobacteria bacterium]